MNKEHIIKKNYDFQRIIKNTSPYKYKEYIIYIEKDTTATYKFGFSVGKKIGKAVVRNKIKRQLRSIVSKKNYESGFNCIIIVNNSILNCSYLDMKQDLVYILHKLNLIKGEI